MRSRLAMMTVMRILQLIGEPNICEKLFQGFIVSQRDNEVLLKKSTLPNLLASSIIYAFGVYYATCYHSLQFFVHLYETVVAIQESFLMSHEIWGLPIEEERKKKHNPFAASLCNL